MSREHGFTLFETLIYITITSIVLLAALGILNVVTRINASQIAKTEVDRNLDFVNRRFTYWGLRAKAVYPSAPTSTDEVRFIADDTFGRFWLDTTGGNGILKFQEATGTPEDLSTSKVIVSAGQIGEKLFDIQSDTVHMNIKVRYKKGGSPFGNYERVTKNSISPRTQGALWPDGLAGYWPFDESSPTSTQIFDASGNANEGAMRGSALKFDGSNDYVNIGNNASIDLTKPLSIEAWIYPLGLTSFNTIVGKRGSTTATNYVLRIQGTGSQLTYYFHDGSAFRIYPANYTFSVSRWYHVAVTVDVSGNIEFFVNGNSIASTSTPYTAVATTNNLGIGSYNGNGASELFNGVVDDVRIYNRALTATEIRDHFNHQFPAADSGLKLYTPFSNRSGAVASDTSGTAPPNNGTLTGFSSTNAGVGDTSSSGWTTYGRPNRTTPGKRGNALQFNGRDDNALIGDSASLEGFSSLTLEAWVLNKGILSGNSYGNIVQKENSYNFKFRLSPANMEDWVNTGTWAMVATSSAPSSDVWHHVVSTWTSGSSGKIYIDGIDATGVTSVASGTIQSNAESVTIGARRSTFGIFTEFFNGVIDEVRVYKRLLTPGEISLHYNALK